MQNQMDLSSLIHRLTAFRDARDWKKFHSVKNLMASLAIEAAELMELGQWKTDAEMDAALKDDAFRTKFEHECADVFLYLLLLCERTGIDPVAAGLTKMALNESRYPVEKAKGNALKYNEFE